jgi:glycosyltransferase involved in cell wall biosynthesis
MRVALLGPYPTDGQVPGGVDAVVLALSRGLSRRPGVELHVVTAVPGLPSPTSQPLAGFTLHRVPHPRLDRLLWHRPVVRQLDRAVAAIHPDIVHGQMSGPYADAALRSGRPAVVSLHGVVFREAALAAQQSSFPERLRFAIDAQYERWIIRRSRHLIATTPYTRREFEKLTAATFFDIENPVDSVFFDVPAPADPAGGESRLLCIAQVYPRKDILTLLRAFARVHAECPEAALEIVGQTDVDPSYLALAQAEIGKLGLGARVRFLGSLPAPDLAAACARADVVMLTSLQETAPVALAVAMAAGRPVVATRVGGVPDMVTHGGTGLLTEPGDVPGLTNAALALLTQPALRRAFGQVGRETARRRWHVDAVVAQTLAVYRHLIAAGGAR